MSIDPSPQNMFLVVFQTYIYLDFKKRSIFGIIFFKLYTKPFRLLQITYSFTKIIINYVMHFFGRLYPNFGFRRVPKCSLLLENK